MDDADSARPPAATVRRIDERLGLAISRVSLSGRTLVTYARDHVTVRTPSRPDFHDGNTIDLLAPPDVDDLDGWIERFAETTGRMGVDRVHLRWEEPLAADAPPATPTPDPGLAPALARRGLDLAATSALLLGDRPEPQGAPVETVAVAPPSAVPGGATDRCWHAATVLYRYASGQHPDEWRDADEGFVAWSVDVQRELAAAGRAQVWLAMRHGAPVGRVTLCHDRQGLAAVEDLVVHPVHRRRRIAAALMEAAVDRHLEEEPEGRVGVEIVPGTAGDRLQRRLGFVPHATVWSALAR